MMGEEVKVNEDLLIQLRKYNEILMLSSLAIYRGVIFDDIPTVDFVPSQIQTATGLYSLMAQNVRCDIACLENFDARMGQWGLVTMFRDLRNTMEAYYDLFNLSKDEHYLDLLHYHAIRSSDKTAKQKAKRSLLTGRYSNFLKGSFLTAKNKGKIAKEKNHMPDNTYDFLDKHFKIL